MLVLVLKGSQIEHVNEVFIAANVIPMSVTCC